MAEQTVTFKKITPAAERVFEALVKSTYTKQECYARLALLGTFLEHVRFGGERPSDLPAALIALGGEGEPARAEALALWGSELLEVLCTLPEGDLQKFKDRIGAARELMLYVPMHLSDASITLIGLWCREHLGEEILIDLAVDPAAAGGCIFVWGSTLHDFSLGYFVAKQAQAIAALIDRETALPRAHTTP